MEKKLDNEIKNLVKLGIPEDFAFIIACGKIGKPELAQEALASVCELQDEIANELHNFVPLETTISKPTLELEINDKNEVKTV